MTTEARVREPVGTARERADRLREVGNPLALRPVGRRPGLFGIGLGVALVVGLVVMLTVVNTGGPERLTAAGPKHSVDDPGPRSGWPTTAKVPQVAVREGSEVAVTPYDTSRGVPGAVTTASAVCLEWRVSRCSAAQGSDVKNLAIVDGSSRAAQVQALFGPARWRREVQAFSSDVVTTPVRVNGQSAVVAAPSLATGDTVFVQWESNDVSFILSGDGGMFTPKHLIAVARDLRLVERTVPAAVGVAVIKGSPPKGLIKPKTKGIRPGQFTYLASQTTDTADGTCVGVGAFSQCMPIAKNLPSVFVVRDLPIVEGTAPAGTTRIVARDPKGRTFTIVPTSVGPNARFRYFAQWLPRPDLGPFELTMHNRHGDVLARVNASVAIP